MKREIAKRLHAKLQAWGGKIPMTEAGYQIVLGLATEALEEIADHGYRIVVHDATDEDKRLRRSPRFELIFRRPA
jgi:hypothetical protein